MIQVVVLRGDGCARGVAGRGWTSIGTCAGCKTYAGISPQRCPPAVDRGWFYQGCVIDAILERSPADYVRRPTVPAKSPTLGLEAPTVRSPDHHRPIARRVDDVTFITWREAESHYTCGHVPPEGDAATAFGIAPMWTSMAASRFFDSRYRWTPLI
jgi:hypothetical protein